MFSDEELSALLVDLESDRVERKASLSDGDRIRQTICAFANDLGDSRLPGVIFVGVNDDGSSSGLSITDEVLRTLADMRSDGNILPFPTLSVQKRTLAGIDQAVVAVLPSDSPPVRFKGRVWIRVGPRRATATADEVRLLAERRRAGDLTFDQRPVAGSTVNDLDLDFLRQSYRPAAVPADVLIENNRPVEQQLYSLHFLAADGRPNAAAILVLGKDPLRWFPGAYVQFVRFDGSEITDPIRHQREVSGKVSDVVRMTDKVLEANTSVSTDVTSGPVEIRMPDYPLEALKQLARNAIMHRTYESTNAPVRIYWYSDRVDFQSPGGPYGRVNGSNIGDGHTCDYRNPLVSAAMKTLGFVQRFGLGFPLASKELTRNGSPELRIQSSSTSVLVTVRRRP